MLFDVYNTYNLFDKRIVETRNITLFSYLRPPSSPENNRFYFSMLGIEPSAFLMSGNHSTTKLHPQILRIINNILKIINVCFDEKHLQDIAALCAFPETISVCVCVQS